MGRRSRKEIHFQDPRLESLIKNFCVNIKIMREAENLTQQELAEKSQLAVNTIAEIEQQRIENLRLSTITSLGNALKVPPLKLLKKSKK